MANRYWVGGSGTWDAVTTTNWSATSGGAGGASAPVAADAVIFDSASGTGTCTTASGAICTTISFNTSTLTLVLGANLTISSSFTLTAGTVDLNSYALRCLIFTSTAANARTLAFGATGKVEITRTTTVTNAFDTHNVTVPIVYTGTPLVEMIGNAAAGTTIGFRGTVNAINPLSIRITTGSGTINIGSGFAWNNIDFTGFSGTWNAAAINIYGNVTLSPTMTSVFASTPLAFLKASGIQTITSNGVTINTGITVNSSGVTVACADALTLGSTRTLTMTAGTMQLKNGVTSTVGSFVATSANVKFLQSTTPGSQATLSQASGTVNVVDLTISDINAIGGASWNAYTDFENTDAGNNDGWNFSLSPPYTTAELPVNLRSFTHPRRF
jgi:hypothetical protein